MRDGDVGCSHRATRAHTCDGLKARAKMMDGDRSGAWHTARAKIAACRSLDKQK